MTKKDFLENFPNLRKEWNYQKNNKLKLYLRNRLKTCTTKVWWKCKKGHEWESSMRNRTRGRNCPYCANNRLCENGSNSLDFYATAQLKQEWNEEKNGSMKLYSRGSGKKVWWKCTKGHEWKTSLYNRTSRIRECPFCCNIKICPISLIKICPIKSVSLENKAPEQLKQEWDEEKNGSMKLYAPSSDKKVWWICRLKGHKWTARIADRTRTKNIYCPYCINRKMCEDGSNSLESIATEKLKQEWDEEKNGSMKLYSPDSGKKVWWKCREKGHKWEEIVRVRKNGYGCPYCSNHRMCEDGSNSLKNEADEQLKQEWNEEKNGSMKLYSPKSGKKVWWKCKKGHEWQTDIKARRNGSGCPYCRQFKLESEFQTFCKDLNLDFNTQTRYKDTKNKRPLPYDASIKYKNTKTRVELQGSQHYDSSSHYYKYTKISLLQEYVKRINTDNKKSYSTLKAKHNFLSISYLCLGEISTIVSQYVEDLENYDILLRYYITPYIYLQYSENNGVIFTNTEMCCEPTDEMLLIHRIYLHQIESLQNPIEVEAEDFTECCGKLYFNDTVHIHKMLENHS